MSVKSLGAKVFANIVVKKMQDWIKNPVDTQNRVFRNLIDSAKDTAFGKDHKFDQIGTHQDFVDSVPIREYEALKPYVERIKKGEKDVLWPGQPIYFAKTSGTTSGAKFIPLTKESMPDLVAGARNAMLNYIVETGKTDFVDGKMIFLQGSPEMTEVNGIPVGRLSGISAHYVPSYLQKNRLPSWSTNRIEDWEEKLEAIIKETLPEDMTVISGIPSWVQMYFEHLMKKTGKPVGEIFPNFSLFVYGGVNFEPYRKTFNKLIGREIPSIELFPASEGFFAFQDQQNNPGMLLRLDAGIFYEFVKVDDFFNDDAKRLSIGEVEKDVNYVMIISTTAGLWAYNLGDTVQFTSLNPYRVIVSGRLKHFISAFGEHVIGKEVEVAMKNTLQEIQARVKEFTVAPQANPEKGMPFHEWFIEFDQEPENLDKFAERLDHFLCEQNSYYDDLIQGKILRTLLITKIKPDGFQNYMRSIGKLGGQNKIPRLSNDRKIADKLQNFTFK